MDELARVWCFQFCKQCVLGGIAIKPLCTHTEDLLVRPTRHKPLFKISISYCKTNQANRNRHKMTPKILQKQSEREKKAPRTPNDHRAAGKKN